MAKPFKAESVRFLGIQKKEKDHFTETLKKSKSSKSLENLLALKLDSRRRGNDERGILQSFHKKITHYSGFMRC